MRLGLRFGFEFACVAPASVFAVGKVGFCGDESVSKWAKRAAMFSRACCHELPVGQRFSFTVYFTGSNTYGLFFSRRDGVARDVYRPRLGTERGNLGFRHHANHSFGPTAACLISRRGITRSLACSSTTFLTFQEDLMIENAAL